MFSLCTSSMWILNRSRCGCSPDGLETLGVLISWRAVLSCTSMDLRLQVSLQGHTALIADRGPRSQLRPAPHAAGGGLPSARPVIRYDATRRSAIALNVRATASYRHVLELEAAFASQRDVLDSYRFQLQLSLILSAGRRFDD